MEVQRYVNAHPPNYNIRWYILYRCVHLYTCPSALVRALNSDPLLSRLVLIVKCHVDSSASVWSTFPLNCTGNRSEKDRAQMVKERFSSEQKLDVFCSNPIANSLCKFAICRPNCEHLTDVHGGLIREHD